MPLGTGALLALLSIPCYGFAHQTPTHLAMPPAVTQDLFDRDLNEGKNLRRVGHLAEASRFFQKAADGAEKSGNYGRQAEALVAKSGCEIRLFHYAVALNSAGLARSRALQARDKTFAGAADVNLSAIYSQLGDFAAARNLITEAVEVLAQSPRKDYYLNALGTKAEIEFGLHQSALGTNTFQQALAVAKDAKLPRFEASLADHLGSWMTLEGDLPKAESALSYAQKLYSALQDNDGLAGTYEHLAELEWRKGGSSLRAALSHIDLAFSTQSESFKTSPQYYPIHIRGQILLSLGQKDKAIAEFRRSVEAADEWRLGALPGDTTNLRTVVQLESVYKDFAHLAAELSLERDDIPLKREAFEVLARNRAASLREQQTRSYRNKLLDSPEYFEVLQELQKAQATATLEKDPTEAENQRQSLNRLRARLSDLENKIGLSQQNRLASSEKKGARNSLTGIQARLRPSEALLSFSLGDRKSFLWTVTSDEVRLYDLPKQEIIAVQSGNFSRAVSGDGANRIQAARALSRSIFSTVPPSVQRKPNWLLTLDGALLDKVPFAALPASYQNSDQPVSNLHTLRILPSAFILQSPGSPKVSGRFVGIADPIYNLADPRLDPSVKKAAFVQSGKPKSRSKVLGRLAASDTEINSSAEKCGLPQKSLLTGKEAAGVPLRAALQQLPEILHFAVHVISPPEFPQEAALALSLTKDNLPELLTAESAATYRVSGSLVVLSGCASQQGEVLPGAGLVGLSRGWLLAGASAVLVSAWPTPDSYKSFFPVFYTYYRQASGPVGVRAAIALQKTQIDLQHQGGAESDPRFWAAYSIISKE